MVACATSAFLITRASPGSTAPSTPASAQRRSTTGPRNLALRPEARSVSRRLGNRFNPTSRIASSSSGNLTIEGTQQAVAIVRRQTEAGETVELFLGSRELTWSEREGISAVSAVPTDKERLLMERLVLDSPDQFVLAQLRGASYFTVTRNVRPSEAGDDYSGPLWNLVRVDEPQQNENLRPQSTWRIYYINAQTGLPDRIEYQLNGQEIRTEFVEWSEQNGEKTPLRITWSSGGQMIMEYRATSVSHN